MKKKGFFLIFSIAAFLACITYLICGNDLSAVIVFFGIFGVGLCIYAYLKDKAHMGNLAAAIGITLSLIGILIPIISSELDFGKIFKYLNERKKEEISAKNILEETDNTVEESVMIDLSSNSNNPEEINENNNTDINQPYSEQEQILIDIATNLRLTTVERMNALKQLTNNQEILANIAMNLRHTTSERTFAISHLTDKAVLRQITTSTRHTTSERELASKRLGIR